MGGEPPEEARGKGICSNVGQTDVVEPLVKAGCSCRLVNADLYSGERRRRGEQQSMHSNGYRAKIQSGMVKGLVLEVHMWVHV